VKTPGSNHFRPVNRVRKPLAEDGKSFRRCVQDASESLLPGKRQTPRAEQNRYQVVIGVQRRYAAEAASRLERPPKLRD